MAKISIIRKYIRKLGTFRSSRKAVSVLFIVLSVALTSSDSWVYAQVLPTPAQQNEVSQLPIAKPAITVQSVLVRVCEAKGYDEKCAKTLLGILWKESQNDAKAIGDNGRARGYFQIHYKMHGVTVTCAEDLECSANWTLNYLESNGYPANVMYAIQCHNGCNSNNGYAASTRRWSNLLWEQELPASALAFK